MVSLASLAMDWSSAGAGFYTPCPMGRNLVDLVNLFPCGNCPGAGPSFNLVDLYMVSLASLAMDI